MEVERVRGEHPDDPSWRADALAASRHSRLLDELRMPLDDHDPERAEILCGEVARVALRDYSPALMLLAGPLRRRAQALAAYALTLFDFAAQRGLEGERLAQINRWEFDLELALEGRPPGQPVFVQMAREEARRPWPRPALDEIAGAARRRAVRGRGGGERAAADARRLARALTAALIDEPAEGLAELGAALFELRRLTDGPPAPDPPARRSREARVRRHLEAAGKAPAPPPEVRGAARYLRRAARAMLRRAEHAPTAGTKPPTLGLGARLGFLLLARIGL